MIRRFTLALCALAAVACGGNDEKPRPADPGACRPIVPLVDYPDPWGGPVDCGALDGYEVLRRIRANAGLRTLPVVVLTSSDEARDVAASYDRGANSYVVKPVEYPALIGTLVDLTRYWLAINEPALN